MLHFIYYRKRNSLISRSVNEGVSFIAVNWYENCILYFILNTKYNIMSNQENQSEIKITIDPKGPYTLIGDLSAFQYFIINGEDGEVLRYEKGDKNYSRGRETVLCRCGSSKSKPYCDGSHMKADWDPRLTSVNEKFMNGVVLFEGPRYVLYDKQLFCGRARFCKAGVGVWDMITDPQSEDEIELSVKISLLCPSGRLVIKDKQTGDIIESHIEQSVGLIEDTPLGVSGPIWVRGGVPIMTGVGDKMERQNRITLCRCGASMNKPFCDGAHIAINFNHENF